MQKAWKLWKELKDALETVLLAVAGIGAIAVMIAAMLVAFVTAVRNLPLTWQIAFITAVFVLGIVILCLLCKVVPRIRVRWNPFWRESEIAPERPLPNWLQAVVDCDTNNPARKAFVYKLTINLHLMERDGSYRFNLLIDVFNGAVYDLTIGTKVEGWIDFELTHLSPPPTISRSNPAGIITHAHRGSLELDQDVTVMGPIVGRLREKEGQRVRFDLESLIIWATYRQPGGEVIAEFPLRLSPSVFTQPIAFIK